MRQEANVIFNGDQAAQLEPPHATQARRDNQQDALVVFQRRFHECQRDKRLAQANAISDEHATALPQNVRGLHDGILLKRREWQ
jgi:hypothetical protein